ncbi:HlyD family efflux transporter periplasmic adaptor subunit [Pseudooceanicola sp. CBS1P-1]|uniref:HlyD family efflux transporter periplasmic adaptor subunit n=1 Tax=Pseudooceanicola albus TaxID=2692189 RepID=A0A6L7G7Z1_9RHOB|nr:MULTISPECIES: HlyD family efflux transporter periplasmic adaptor subunit [Pseudooceanicola]MBT9385827.1 HlyD family efflux transporter periplasmic adaptor subunit [Pseudooceanicola endophyticus]MXN20059.1 HlyD family efflux transporter periplasmic adaptor subunit [Pseudooceanicola albus]
MILCTIPLLAGLLSACTPAPFATGYVEGDYTLIAPIETAQIRSVEVARGARVSSGTLLVQMEDRDATIALAQAEAALAEARSSLADLREGKRPEEIRVLEATLASARAQAEEADRQSDRLAKLNERGAATQADRDDAATAAKVAHAAVAEAEATLAVARLPARPQEIAAAEATVEGARAARDKAQWSLDQRRLSAPATGTIDDVIRTGGEVAGPSAPVLSMLADGAVKLRLYVPEAEVARIAPGALLDVECDACAPGLQARVSYVSDGPEFTPPVIYSLQNRQKLVYLIEARPTDGSALKPGQIVSVTLPGAGS